MKRIRFGYVAFAALVTALAIPAAGVSKGSALPTSVGAGEGKLTLVAWEGYTEKQWVAPFEKADRLSGLRRSTPAARTTCST